MFSLRHIFRFGGQNRGAQPGVAVRVAAAALGGYGDLPDQACEYLAALCIQRALLVLDCGHFEWPDMGTSTEEREYRRKDAPDLVSIPRLRWQIALLSGMRGGGLGTDLDHYVKGSSTAMRFFRYIKDSACPEAAGPVPASLFKETRAIPRQESRRGFVFRARRGISHLISFMKRLPCTHRTGVSVLLNRRVSIIPAVSTMPAHGTGGSIRGEKSTRSSARS